MSEMKPREVTSNIEAYSHAPWGEELGFEETSEFLHSFRESPGGFVRLYRESPETEPYLYVHGINYGADNKSLIENEFTGGNAYYRTDDIEKITQALTGLGLLTYIANIHADKSVVIPDKLKPRLKILPSLLNEIFLSNGSDSIVLFTHEDTSVHRSVMLLDMADVEINRVPYGVAESPDVSFNSGHSVEELVLFILKRTS